MAVSSATARTLLRSGDRPAEYVARILRGEKAREELPIAGLLSARPRGGRCVSHPPPISASQRRAMRAVGLLGAPFLPLVAAFVAWRPGGVRGLDGAPFRGVAAVVYAWRRRPRAGNRG